MDWGAGHFTVIVGTGDVVNENCLLSQALDNFFSNAQGLPGGMLAAGIDSHKSCF